MFSITNHADPAACTRGTTSFGALSSEVPNAQAEARATGTDTHTEQKPALWSRHIQRH